MQPPLPPTPPGPAPSEAATAAATDGAAATEADAAEIAGAYARAPHAMREPEAIFVVGVSRSGTTLMRRVLDSHSRIAITTESHYLGHLLPWEGARRYFRRAGDLRDDAAIVRLVDLIYSGEFQRRSRLRQVSPYWTWLTRVVDREAVARRLLAAERTERGIFAAFMRLYADRRGKAVMGEKTPAHLAYVETLLEWFPGGRVIHMMRDPRAIYVSELRRREAEATSVPYRWLVRAPALFRAFVLVEVGWAWASAVRRHRALARRCGEAYRLVRFEELVRRPEPTIRELCAFLGVGFEPRLLQQRVFSKGSMLGQSGFDAGAADRWQESIEPQARRWIERMAGRRLEALGYRREAGSGLPRGVGGGPA